MLKRLFAVLAVALLLGPAAAQEKPPAGARVVKLEARPETLRFQGPFDYAQLLLTAVLDTGERIDATRFATFQAPTAQVKVSPTGLVRPVADGLGVIQATFQGRSVTLPLEVNGQKAPYQASFVRDVMPAMSKLGCNAGTCHGAAQGKNGFKLSLRGYDPLADHQSLTDDSTGRRFNRAAPDFSLMLLKPAGTTPHVGGVLAQPGEPYYELIRLWIAQGVKLDLEAPRVVALDVEPKGPVLPLPGVKQQFAVRATYSNGVTRDVSAEAFIESSNTEIATVDKTGLVTAVRRGEATMLARYEGAYAASTLIVMGDRSGFAWQETPTHNHIDELVYEKLRSVKVLPSGLCSDADFVRRVYLDLTGLPPEPEVVRAFLADTRPTRVKRDELIDRLVGSAEYVEHWTNKWADLLQVNRKFLGEKGAAALRTWIRQAVASNMPYDRFAHAVLTGSGSNLENPPAGYYKVLRDPASAMENTTHLFLAVRFNCNKCHDHPFERWTQDQYYQLAAYFAQVGRKEDPAYRGQRLGGSAVEGAVPLVEIVSDVGGGDVKHERTGKVTPPKFPYDHAGALAAATNRRQQLAQWVASKDNVYFARSYVNRLWAYLLGVGIIEPIDDIRAGNPPSNPKLLDRLTKDFVDSGFNVQQALRTICKSRTYQHALETNRWNADDEMNFSHALARRLPAEVLYDAIHRATGSVARLPGLPAGARASQLLDSSVELPGAFLELFGKPPRESACECERSGGMMLGPVLGLVNGPVIGDAVKDPTNRVARIVAGQKDDAKVVEELFLSILCRPPTADEVKKGLAAFQGVDAEFEEMKVQRARAEAALVAYEKELPARQAEWEKSLREKPQWEPLEVVTVASSGGAALAKQADGSVLASGKLPSPEVYTVTAKTKLRRITGIRLEVLPDPNLPAMGPGRAPNGNFVLNEFRVSLTPEGEPNKVEKVAFGKAVADFAQDGFSAQAAVDNNPGTGWAIAPQFGKQHTAIFETRRPPMHAPGATLTITLDQQFPGRDHNIGKFRLSVSSSRSPGSLSGPPDAVAKLLAVEPAKRTPQQQAELLNYFRSQDDDLTRLQKALADLPVPGDKRILAAQDLAWALLNSKAFLFNH